jgi:hypothetical protein
VRTSQEKYTALEAELTTVKDDLRSIRHAIGE